MRLVFGLERLADVTERLKKTPPWQPIGNCSSNSSRMEQYRHAQHMLLQVAVDQVEVDDCPGLEAMVTELDRMV